MTGNRPYQLEIWIETPDVLEMDQSFQAIYHIKNRSGRIFPGATFACIMWSPLLPRDLFVNHPVVLEKPIKDGDDYPPISQSSDKPFSTEYILITLIHDHFNAIDGVPIEFYSKDGRKIENGRIIHSFRVRSPEEVLTNDLLASSRRLETISNRFVESSNSILNSSQKLENLTIVLLLSTLMLFFYEVLNSVRSEISDINSFYLLVAFSILSAGVATILILYLMSKMER